MKARILIVDDEQDMVDLLSFNLHRRGYEVIEARTGTDALNKARMHLPDLVLLDLMLDGLDCFTVCECLRREPSTADMPVIMITALSGVIPRANGLVAGATDFVTKPVDVNGLMDRVRTLLDEQQRKIPFRRLKSEQSSPEETGI